MVVANIKNFPILLEQTEQVVPNESRERLNKNKNERDIC